MGRSILRSFDCSGVRARFPTSVMVEVATASVSGQVRTELAELGSAEVSSQRSWGSSTCKEGFEFGFLAVRHVW